MIQRIKISEPRICQTELAADLRAVCESLISQLEAKDRELALADMTIENQRQEIARLEERCERLLNIGDWQ